jgi:hypothetical protein
LSLRKELSASDLEDHITCHIEICLTKMADVNEPYPGPIDRSRKNSKVLDAADIKKEFKVSDAVATKIAGYQQDILAEFHDAIGEMLGQSKRYLEVSHLLDTGEYDSSILREYIYLSIPTKELNPKRYLRKAVGGISISTCLLAVAVVAARIPQLDLGIDPLGGWVLGLIWGGITFVVAAGVPKRYKTKKFLFLLNRAKAAASTGTN